MDKNYNIETIKQSIHQQQKILIRRTSDIISTKDKENKKPEIEERKKSKSPFKLIHKNSQINNLITSNSISLNEFKKKCPPTNKAFKDFSLIQFQNQNHRNYMEDRFSILINFPNNDNCKALFAIFDGHGGSSVSEYLCKNYINIFLKLCEKFENKNYEKIFQKSFYSLDEEIKKIPGSNKMGSTGTIILITKETDQILGSQKIIYCANIGDTNCELFSKNNCKKISYEHRCNDLNEEKRIKKKNGNIINGRLGGIISITRSFGDFNLKDFGLICEPSVNKVNVSFNDRYYLILATDGVWDFVSEEDIFFFTINHNDSMDICKNIVDKAKNNGSTDNITCIVIDL